MNKKVRIKVYKEFQQYVCTINRIIHFGEVRFRHRIYRVTKITPVVDDVCYRIDI